MISIQVTGLKDFMGKLLASDCFDSFLLEEAVITTYNEFVIDGHIQKDFFTTEEWADVSCHPYPFSLWKDMRACCFDLIKGKKTPVRFKFVLRLLPDAAARLLSKDGAQMPDEQMPDLILTIRYDGARLTCTTGTVSSFFSLDKSPDRLWDKAFRLFLEKKEIACLE